eukprot:4253039-Prymnesium_polylepis.1
MGAAAAAAAAAGACRRQQQQQQQRQQARSRPAVARAASVCRVHVRTHVAIGNTSHSPAQQPQRMPPASRSKQLSIVLDPA